MIYVCDGELVCEECAVDVTDDEAWIGGETDSPRHCSCCHRPLFDDGAGLTSEGVSYVLAAVRKELKRGTRSPHVSAWNASMIWEHGHYKGQPWIAVTRDWAEYVLDNHHRLAKRDRRTLEIFMHWTRHYSF